MKDRLFYPAGVSGITFVNYKPRGWRIKRKTPLSRLCAGCEKHYREEVGKNPDDSNARYGLGLDLRLLGKYEEARAEIMKPVELFENDGNSEGMERSMKLLEGIKDSGNSQISPYLLEASLSQSPGQ